MIFLKLEYAGQNENNGLYPKRFGVIFFQPLLLDSEHGDNITATRQINEIEPNKQP